VLLTDLRAPPTKPATAESVLRTTQANASTRPLRGPVRRQ